MDELRLAIVIPTLNEEARVGLRLQEVLGLACVHRVVVSDGGSEDATHDEFQRAAAAAPPGKCLWVDGLKGRARQMNAGAQVVAEDNDVLLFLHADVQLPDGFGQLVQQALQDPGTVGGAFRTWTVDDHPVESQRALWRPLLHLADVRSRYSGLPYGDQAMFVRTAVFKRVGGFPDQPLMEDLEFSRRLRRQGRVVVLPAAVRVSGRRFVARPLFYTFVVNVFPALYRLGVSPASLEKVYRAVR